MPEKDITSWKCYLSVVWVEDKELHLYKLLPVQEFFSFCRREKNVKDFLTAQECRRLDACKALANQHEVPCEKLEFF